MKISKYNMLSSKALRESQINYSPIFFKLNSSINCHWSGPINVRTTVFLEKNMYLSSLCLYYSLTPCNLNYYSPANLSEAN